MRTSGFKAAGAVALALGGVMASCHGGGTEAAVPRPQGYHRIEMPAPDYAPAAGIPIGFEVNGTDTRLTVDTTSSSSIWLTIEYPGHGAAICLTFTPVLTDKESHAVAANRYERISRDLGPAMGIVEAESDAGPFTVYATDEAIPTPAGALLYATDRQNHRWVVSGSVTLTSPEYVTDPDSLIDVRDYIMEDFWHGFRSSRP